MQYPYRAFNTLSNWVIGFAWLFGLGGIIGGITLAAQTVTTYGEFYGPTTTRPFIWLGVAVIIAAIAQAVFMTWMAYFGKVVIANGHGFRAERDPHRAPRWGEAGYFSGGKERTDPLVASAPN